MLKITAISDTHCYHSRLNLAGGDILIHAGDISGTGRKEEVKAFIQWFEKQPYEYKIFIAGNHDKSFDPKFHRDGGIPSDRHKVESNAAEWVKELLDGFIENPNHFYLENTSCEIKDIKFWGSPWTPWFHGEFWAFNKQRGDEINEVWQQIPMGTDFVITHGPSYMKLDKVEQYGSSNYGEYVGCEMLDRRLQEVKPIMHICGHIHEGYGYEYGNGIHYINAACMNMNYIFKNKPVDFILDEETKEITFI